MTSVTYGAAVITFNGMKHLPQQLDSILPRTRSVQHIVISDGNSGDGARALSLIDSGRKHAGVDRMSELT